MARINKTVKTRNGKFILFIGDEGAILVYLQGKKVMRRLFIANPEPMNTRALQDALANDPKAPVSILIDMIDQSFIKQTLPPVSQFSVNKLIRRRLERDFATDDIKGSIILGREKGGRKDWNYLMVSLASSPVLNKWVDLIAERENPFGGIFLLPLESEQYIKKLVEGNNIKSDSQWQLLVSHNKVSGFRQVVLQNGKIVFTRMAQPIGDSMPEVIAGNIEQEIVNTSEYLKRLGFSDQAGFDIFIVVSEDIKNSIDKSKIKCTNCFIYTPYEIAAAMDLEQAAQPEDHFGDVVFATHFGSAKKHVLTLQTRYTEKLSKLVAASKAIRLAAALAALGIFIYTGQMAYEGFETYQTIGNLETQKSQNNATLQQTKDKAKKLPIDTERITDVVGLYETFNKAQFTPAWYIQKIHNTLGKDALIQSISWNLSEPMGISQNEDKRFFNGNFKVEFLVPSNDSKLLGQTAEKYLDRVKTEFKEFTVTNTPLPGLLEDNETLTLNDAGNAGAQQGQGKELQTVDITISPILKKP